MSSRGEDSPKGKPPTKGNVARRGKARGSKAAVTRRSTRSAPVEVEETTPELDDSPPPSINDVNVVRNSVRLNSNSLSNDDVDLSPQKNGSVEDESNEQPMEESEPESKTVSDKKSVKRRKVATAGDNKHTAVDEVKDEDEDRDDSDDDNLPLKRAKSEDVEDTEMVSEDDLPSETKEPLETEAVSDEELPNVKENVDLPETESVSEDELPLESDKKKKKKVVQAAETEAVSEDELPEELNKKKDKDDENGEESVKSKNEADGVNENAGIDEVSEIGGDKDDNVEGDGKKSDTQKKKLAEGEYDPSSPTSENSQDEPTSASAKKSSSESKTKTNVKKGLPELEKYWKAVQDDPTDFTGWTYLLQYVDQENDTDAAREAYDAFLSHYPYCYGYWRKYADYEKKKGNIEQCNKVFDRGLTAIPLSVDLWLHYLNYCKSLMGDDQEKVRKEFERAIQACGLEFRSDRLWESYIKWETDNKNLTNITALYDRLLATPTQGYTTHFDSFQEHVSSNPPQKILLMDDFLEIRREVLQMLKQYDTPAAAVAAGEEAPPGAEVEEQADAEKTEPAVAAGSTRMDEETSALRERIISTRRKVHKATVSAVASRWNYEEGIKRPYFHVKPLERCQLKNWKEYLDFETEQGDNERIVVLYERCLIACALYEEFWVRFIRYLEKLPEDMTEKIRDVYERACLIHHKKKPNLHLLWACFEESAGNLERASEVLMNLDKSIPNILQVAYRRINLERRRGNKDKVVELYEHYLTTNKSKQILTNLTVKYARFTWKILGDLDKCIDILSKSIEKDKDNPRFYLQLIDVLMQKIPMDEESILAVFDQFINRDCEPEQKLTFAQRKVEFLEDFGSNITAVQNASDEYQRYLKQVRDKKKKDTDVHKDTTTSGSSTSKKSKGDSSMSTVQNSPATATAPPTSYPTSAQGGYAQGYGSGPYQQGQYPPGYNYGQYGQQGDQNYSGYQNWQNYSQGNYGNYGQTGWSGYYGNY